LKCKKIIDRGETAQWLNGIGLLHNGCGLGSSNNIDLLPIYEENPAYDKNPFENILEHTPEFYTAKEERVSRD
jgi:hypothetical protein